METSTLLSKIYLTIYCDGFRDGYWFAKEVNQKNNGEMSILRRSAYNLNQFIEIQQDISSVSCKKY
jgi:hypothetical protein